jgi:hypothetical protein
MGSRCVIANLSTTIFLCFWRVAHVDNIHILKTGYDFSNREMNC